MMMMMMMHLITFKVPWLEFVEIHLPDNIKIDGFIGDLLP